MIIPFKLRPFVMIVTCIFINTRFASGTTKCQPGQQSLLLEFRKSIHFIHQLSTKLVSWNSSKDCCHWSGVQCDKSTGQVTGLDLSEEAIISSIDNLSSMFRLNHLSHLNLAYNPFLGSIPSAMGNLSSLTNLNLSHTGFTGQVPIQISQLTSLVVLDLSMTKFEDDDPFASSSLQITSPNLAVIMKNLSQLKKLYLGGIVFSDYGKGWGEALSSLSNLQVLSMPYCDLRGGFHSSLANLRSLSMIDLDYNPLLSSPVPEFLATFTNLTILRLANCSLTGSFPEKIFEVPKLTTLVLESNPNLLGTLPSSIGNLTRLIQLDLFECNFQGIIPPSLGNLPRLNHLDLSFNNFSGPIPMFHSANNLETLYLDRNSLTGRIPNSMFSKDSKLRALTLDSNFLQGPIPNTLFQLRDLEILSLSSNKFNGTIKLNKVFTSLQNLNILDLSYNSLSIDTNNTNESSFDPTLYYLGLASTNLRILPEFLKNQSYLYTLDLSNNQLRGTIPKWIWNDRLNELNLSYNGFVDMEPFPSVFPSNFRILDLHANHLQGQLPAFPSETPLEYLNLSNNSFVGSINLNFGTSLPSAKFISLAKNKIYGTIPTSLCNLTSLRIFDLSHNNLNGTIPDCLSDITQNLAVLNLRNNELLGNILDGLGENCTLETLDLNMNHLGGHIPKSIANCKNLKVLDLGNNQLTDTFPCHLKDLSSLQVLVLRSNQLQGTVYCPQNSSFLPLLQIIDLASNHFTGPLSTLFHGRQMMAESNENPSNISFLQYNVIDSAVTYYQDEVTVTFKSSDFEMQKILTIFTCIDLSNNAFHGELPPELKDLNALKVLNLSHNSLSGNIPKSVGILSQLESLDLSYNSLSGSIPQELASLSFIGYLNLSFNKLTGLIPTSTQLQSFDASAYEGNPGLYGPPLTVGGKNGHGPELRKPDTPDGSYWNSKKELQWLISGGAVGLALGIVIFFGPLVFIKRLRDWYNYHVDRLVMKMLPNENSQKRRKANRKLRHRN